MTTNEQQKLGRRRNALSEKVVREYVEDGEPAEVITHADEYTLALPAYRGVFTCGDNTTDATREHLLTHVRRSRNARLADKTGGQTITQID